jgi:hypothetical protein
MLRFSYALIAFIAVLPSLVAIQVYGQTRSAPTNLVPSQISNEPLSEATIPLCYIQMENGQRRDLRRLCGKRLTSPASPRSVQRPSVQPVGLDPDDDESAPRATSQPQPTSSPRPSTGTPPPTNPTPTGTPPPTNPIPTGAPSPTNAPPPTASPSPRPPDRPINVQPVPTTLTPSASHPLAIPQDRD